MMAGRGADVAIDVPVAGAQPISEPSSPDRASISEANASERGTMIAHEPISTVGFKELHDAAWAGSDQVLSDLLGQGLDVNAQDEMGYSALILASAAWEGHTECVRLLLRKCADVLLATRDNLTCLHMAAFHGHIDVVNLLLHGKSPRERWDEWDPLIPGLSWKRRRTLMDQKTSSESFTALHMAAAGGHDQGVAITASLLEAYRTSVLGICGLARNPKVDYNIDNELWLDYLLQIRNLLNLEDGDKSPEAILKSLASYGNRNGLVLQEELPDQYKGLVRSYAELVIYSNARDKIGRTALHYAVWKKNVALVKFLTWDLDLGSVANVNTRDMDGYTPLHLAARNGSTDVASALELHRLDGVAKDKLSPRQKLLAKKICLQPNPAARPNQQSRCLAEEILTALHKLSHQHYQCNLESFAWTENRAGVTPLHYAVEKRHENIVKLLVEHPKIDVFHCNSDGQSPWTIAFPPHLKLFHLRDNATQSQRLKKRIQLLLRSGTTELCPKEEEFEKNRSYRQQLLKKAAALAVEVDREGDSDIDAASQLVILEIQIFATFLEKVTGVGGPHGKLTSTCEVDKKLQEIDRVKLKNRKNWDCWEEALESYAPVGSLTLLHVAAFEGCNEELETLLKLKKYKNCINDCENIICSGYTCSGYTALHFAVMKCREDRLALKVLLNEKTLNPIKQNTKDQTPLQVVDQKLDGEKSQIYISISSLLASAKWLLAGRPEEKSHDQEVVHDKYLLQILASKLLVSAKGLLVWRPEAQQFSPSDRLLLGARQLLMGHPEVQQFLEGLHTDRQRNANIATSFMVGSALMATISFSGWLQSPPVYTEDLQNLFPSNPSSADSPASSGPNSRRGLIYWGLNSISFVSALGAMVIATMAAVPSRSPYSDREMDVLYVQRRLRVTSLYLGVSIYCVLAAFAAATRTGASVTSDSRAVLVGYFVMVVAAIVFFWTLAGFSLRLSGFFGIATSKPLRALARIGYMVLLAGCLACFIKFTSPSIYNNI